MHSCGRADDASRKIEYQVQGLNEKSDEQLQKTEEERQEHLQKTFERFHTPMILPFCASYRIRTSGKPTVCPFLPPRGNRCFPDPLPAPHPSPFLTKKKYLLRFPLFFAP